jgi:hypothetical protein
VAEALSRERAILPLFTAGLVVSAGVLFGKGSPPVIRSGVILLMMAS